jgi:sugar lactone lactonase YvrE
VAVAPPAVLVGGLDRPESVAWDPVTGTLVAGGAAGQVYRVDPETTSVDEIARTGGSLLGVALDAEGRIYLCDKVRRAVLRVSPDGGSIEDLTSAGDGTPAFTLPNSLAFGSLGELYISDSGRLGQGDGRILCLAPDGALAPASDDRFQYTNGLAVAADGGSLFVVETDLPGFAVLPIRSAGVLGAPARTVLPRTVPDGILLADGDVPLVTLWRPDAIVLARQESVTVVTEDWRGLVLSAPTGACFFGEGMSSLAVANRGGGHLSIVEPGLTGPLPHRPDGLPRRPTAP